MLNARKRIRSSSAATPRSMIRFSAPVRRVWWKASDNPVRMSIRLHCDQPLRFLAHRRNSASRR